MSSKNCLYCPQPPNSLEHPLPAAFGEFVAAPYLDDRICEKCNNTHLGILDEQLVRCGPEAFFRRHYGVQGRPNHDKVNPFYRGSAGGQRLEMKSRDPNLGIDVLLECENGVYHQARQIIFAERSGKVHHIPIREGVTPEQLRTAFEQLDVEKPFDVHLFCDPGEKAWMESLIKAGWPESNLGDRSTMAPTTYHGAKITVVLTDRYFRAVAKIGFHYFLTQFPEYSGHEPMFSAIRSFVLEDGCGVDRANDCVGVRQHPLLGQMLDPRMRPDGWRAHVLCAETTTAQALAHVQMFVSEDWQAPAYTVCLARGNFVNSVASGHAYVYYSDGLLGRYSGEAFRLQTTRASFTAPPLGPVVTLETTS